MKIRELIELLQKEDLDRVVVMSSDSEGNRFREFSAGEVAAWDFRECETGLEAGQLTAAARAAGYTEEDVLESGVPAFVLYPRSY